MNSLVRRIIGYFSRKYEQYLTWKNWDRLRKEWEEIADKVYASEKAWEERG